MADFDTKLTDDAARLRKRVLFAGILHETHSFVRDVTPLSAFTIRQGGDITSCVGDASTLAGGLQVAEEKGWEVIPAVHMYAMPTGPVSAEAFAFFWAALERTAISAGNVNGVFLDLHGAMVAEGYPDAEGEIIRRLRALPGYATTPIAGPLDLHGNITDAMCGEQVIGTAYRCNPHTDAQETARRAARLLDRLMETGERVTTVRAQPPLLFPPTGTGSADAPTRQLLALARTIEAENPDLLDVSVFPGFAYADIPEAGVCFTAAATVGSADAAQRALSALCEAAWEMREAGCPRGIEPVEAIRRARTVIGKGPAILVEQSDNVGGGAPGDLTPVLSALIAEGVTNAAVCLWDPAAVAEVWDAPIGGEPRTLFVGGKSGELGAVPIRVTGTVVNRTDGEFLLEDVHSHSAIFGRRQSMGRSVVFETDGGITLLLTSERALPMDLGQWRSVGVNPEEKDMIVVKAAIAHRQAYDPIARASYTLDTDGPCTQNLSRLPYTNVRRPVFPLDTFAGEWK